MSMVASGKHRKEKVNAINKLVDNWENKVKLHFNTLTDEDGMFYTSFIGFSSSKIELKGGTEWRWNQSVTNITFILEPEVTVYMHKLNSRRKIPGSGELPSYKVWIYHIHQNHTGEPTMHFIWCEKGTSPIIPEDPSLIRLQDLAFLKQFVETDVAESFGW